MNMTEASATRILLIDDQPLVLAGLAAILEGKGFSCRTAEDGFAALRHFREAIPDVIICDLNMPNMSGFELLSIVRREYPQIAVIVISGAYMTRAEQPGALMNAFFAKGQYHPEELVAKIRELHLESPMLEQGAETELAPLWVSRRNQTSLLVTCNHCLHSFPVDSLAPAEALVHSVECPSCRKSVSYAAQPIALQVLEPIQEVEAACAEELAEEPVPAH
jgi:CheY-like chemotaxis protein